MSFQTVAQIGKSLSEYQLAILIRMSQSLYAVTNEGANFSAWYEYSNRSRLDIPLRRDSLNILYSKGLIVSYEAKIPTRNYYYIISERGLKVLDSLKDRDSLFSKYQI